MEKKRNSNLTGISRLLRKNMTKEEKHLWYDCLKKLPQTFNRQKIIGNYIVDFCCVEAKLVIEVDGDQHYREEGLLKDASRDAFLRECGYYVARYTNIEINSNFEGVCLDIVKLIDARKALL